MRACLSLVMVVVFVTGGCSGDESAKPSYCESASAELVAKIISGTDLTAVDSAAVAGSGTSQDTYVAIRFNTPTGRRSQVGVWFARGDRTTPTAIFAVNPTADSFTEWPSTSETGAIENAELIKGCLS